MRRWPMNQYYFVNSLLSVPRRIHTTESGRMPTLVGAHETNGRVFGSAFFKSRQTDHQCSRRCFQATAANLHQRSIFFCGESTGQFLLSSICMRRVEANAYLYLLSFGLVLECADELLPVSNGTVPRAEGKQIGRFYRLCVSD